MCTPLVALAVGTAISAYGTYQQGQTQQKMADYNANVANTRAVDVENQGATAMAQQENKTRQLIGEQRAQEGASGAQTDTGSFGDVTAQTARFGEQDAQNIRANALRSAWGLQTTSQADQLAGSMSAQAGTWGAAGTMLTGASRVYGMGTGNGTRDFSWS